MSKLDELTTEGNFRRKVELTLATMAEKGERAKIYEAKRTLAQQKAKVKAGASKTLDSHHVRRAPDGGCLAADIADSKKAWNATRRFWMLIGANTLARGLTWGGLFGLSQAQRDTLKAAIGRARKAGWPQKHEAYNVSLGWDPAHVSLDEKAGRWNG